MNVNLNKLPLYNKYTNELDAICDKLTQHRTLIGDTILKELNSIIDNKFEFIFCNARANRIYTSQGRTDLNRFVFYLINRNSGLLTGKLYTDMYLQEGTYAEVHTPLSESWYARLDINISNSNEVVCTITQNKKFSLSSLECLNNPVGITLYKSISSLYENESRLNIIIKELAFDSELVRTYIDKTISIKIFVSEMRGALCEHRENIVENLCTSALNRKSKLLSRRNDIYMLDSMKISNSTSRGARYKIYTSHNMTSSDISYNLELNRYVMYGIAR